MASDEVSATMANILATTQTSRFATREELNHTGRDEEETDFGGEGEGKAPKEEVEEGNDILTPSLPPFSIPPRKCMPSSSVAMSSRREESPPPSAFGARKKTARRKFRKCSREGCDNLARRGGVCLRHGAKRRECSREGCANQAQQGGVCIRHGAKIKRYICRHEGCANKALRGGVCWRHGGRLACCREGCSNQALRGGFCWRHTARETCIYRGCVYVARRGGFCKKHGAEHYIIRHAAEIFNEDGEDADACAQNVGIAVMTDGERGTTASGPSNAAADDDGGV